MTRSALVVEVMLGVVSAPSANLEVDRSKTIADMVDSAAQKGMSALPPKADICSALGDVRFVPKADIPAIFSVAQ